MSRLVDADALFNAVKRHHDLYDGTTNPSDKARRDECLQFMCDINDAQTIDAIPVEWLKKQVKEYSKTLWGSMCMDVLESWRIMDGW